MFEERTGIPVENLVTLIAVDGSEPQVFEEKRDNWTSKLLALLPGNTGRNNWLSNSEFKLWKK